MKYIAVVLLFFALAACGKKDLPKVEVESSMGNLVLEIDTVHAPLTAGNFLKLVDQGLYLNASFYRVVRMDNQPQSPVKIEVIQGGLMDDNLIDKYPGIEHETTEKTGLKHLDGTLSMARNQPGTASTEFFICVGDQPELDFGGKRNPDGQGFAAFGKVVEGMDVVLQIQQLNDDKQYLREPVLIYNIKRLK
ncbi:peptidylprolyl isomerase [Mangrovibacterium diazotrophicum]|uniref:peptidylprolyl isomerase n=1 Tax=Mangrovibacterium diazotrophicum TaxID=1261403 RepID=A0A419W8K3_9BACT|nr:peptidylprolyl isomerase [Mangrovibacterium diazotrophicum]RKD91801.1 peptidyl-prolyl cis-trans isomerase A (cyclophilin A) [Mangrovibacterium diazotrophicum]